MRSSAVTPSRTRGSPGSAAEAGQTGAQFGARAPTAHRFGLDVTTVRWDNPTMMVTLDAKRRLTVPTALAPAKPGDYFDAHFDADEDAIVFRRIGGRESWLAVMKECPVSPDDVLPRRRELSKRRKL